MANTFTPNTADHATLSQVQFNTTEGMFDYKLMQSGGKVVVPAAKTRMAAAVRKAKHPVTGKLYFIES